MGVLLIQKPKQVHCRWNVLGCHELHLWISLDSLQNPYTREIF